MQRWLRLAVRDMKENNRTEFGSTPYDDDDG